MLIQYLQPLPISTVRIMCFPISMPTLAFGHCWSARCSWRFSPGSRASFRFAGWCRGSCRLLKDICIALIVILQRFHIQHTVVEIGTFHCRYLKLALGGRLELAGSIYRVVVKEVKIRHYRFDLTVQVSLQWIWPFHGHRTQPHRRSSDKPHNGQKSWHIMFISCLYTVFDWNWNCRKCCLLKLNRQNHSR